MKAWTVALMLGVFASRAVLAAEAPPATDAAVAEKNAAVTAPAAASASPGTRSAADRLDLDATVVTGNRELPKVLYIVPWKKAELGDLPEQPFNTLLDEALTPIDRDEFRREVSYYSKLTERGTDAVSSRTEAAPASP